MMRLTIDRPKPGSDNRGAKAPGTCTTEHKEPVRRHPLRQVINNGLYMARSTMLAILGRMAATRARRSPGTRPELAREPHTTGLHLGFAHPLDARQNRQIRRGDPRPHHHEKGGLTGETGG